MKWTWQNCVFAWQPEGGRNVPVQNPFSGTSRITLPRDDSGPANLEIAAGRKAKVHTWQDPVSRECFYLWGNAVHPIHSGEALLRWAARSIREGQTDALSELIGMFVLIIDDRRKGCAHLFGDVAGVRPWFVGQHKGRFISGSSVWPIQQAGLGENRVNPDSVASWMWYGYDLTGGSLFSDYRRLSPGAVVTISGQTVRETPYVKITGDNCLPPREQVADFVFEQVSQSFDLLTKDAAALTIGLSGGYDSRLLAALASRKRDVRVELFAVNDSPMESSVARRVAAALGRPLDVLQTDGSLWNLFAEPFHALPEGFPITKQLVHSIAARRPGVPMLNGFVGDLVTRNTGMREDRQLEFSSEAFLTPYLTRRRQLAGLRFDLLDPIVARNVERRAGKAMQALVQKGLEYGKPFLYSGLYGRQRCYTANNMIQHLDISEALAPFYTWRLLDSRFRNDCDCFWWETYELLFQRYFPELAEIPHSARVAGAPRRKPRVSKATPRWAADILTNLLRRDCLPILSRKKAVSRLSGAIIGRPDMEPVVLFLYRLFLLEQRLRQAGISLDWGAI